MWTPASNWTTQLANTVARKLDQRAMTALAAAVAGENVVPGHDWGDLVTIGPKETLTPSAELPTADLSAAQLASDLQELGVTHDLLILHPQEAHALRAAYADRLPRPCADGDVQDPGQPLPCAPP